MYLSKLSLKDFGKFHNKDIELDEGVNIIYGGENSGKTTIKEFCYGMFYGIDKPNNISNDKDNYAKLKPVKRDFAGKAYIKDEDKSYLVERSFLAGARKTTVFDVKAGRDVRLNERHSLQNTLVKTPANTYKDSILVSDVSKLDKIELLQDIDETIKNLSETGDSEISKDKAINYLKAEKRRNDVRPLTRRLDELSRQLDPYENVDGDIEATEEAIKNLDMEFQIEAAKRKRVSRKLVENEDGSITYLTEDEYNEKLSKLAEAAENTSAEEEEVKEKKKKKKKKKKAAESEETEETKAAEADEEQKAEPIDDHKEKEEIEDDEEDEEEDDPNRKKLSDNIFVIFLTGLFVIGVIATVVQFIPFEDNVRKMFIVFTAVFVVITIIEGFYAKGYFSQEENVLPSEEEFKKLVDEFTEEMEISEENEFDLGFAKEYKEERARLKAELERHIERRSEKAKLTYEFNQVFKKRSEMAEELSAIKLAMACIERTSRDIKEDFEAPLYGMSSQILKILTDGDYESIVRVDDKLCIIHGERTTPIEILSKDTLYVIDISIRLAACSLFIKEKLPVVLDCTADGLDPRHVPFFARVLPLLGADQYILLTEKEGIKNMLGILDTPYKYQEL